MPQGAETLHTLKHFQEKRSSQCENTEWGARQVFKSVLESRGPGVNGVAQKSVWLIAENQDQVRRGRL